ncbi:MAG: molybdate ABC transporter substrate-binding protein [Nitrospira sp.]|nr:molybdate ABC transporter substrate-binding protein [Nitrospira sp.]
MGVILPLAWGLLAIVLSMGVAGASLATAAEPLVILASPSLKAPLEALGEAFEAGHPDVRVKLHYESAIDLRRTIAQMQNNGKHHIESGPFHLLAPGGAELITRMEQKYYVLPNTRRPFATARLVLVVPASLAEAPETFEALARDASLRVAIVDPAASQTGQVTQELLEGMGLVKALEGRLDIAHDSAGVLDHILHGQADVGIVRSTEVRRHQDRVRIAAEAPPASHAQIVYEIAMERFCPNRPLCQEFLVFTQSPEARTILKRLGYGVPGDDSVASSR